MTPEALARIAESQAELAAGLGEPYQWGVLPPDPPDPPPTEACK